MEFLPYPTVDSGDPSLGPLKWLNALLHGGKCLGFEKIAVDEDPAVALTIPEGAKAALIYVQADTTVVNSSRVVHFLETGDDPTTGVAGDGMPLPDNGIYECTGAANLANFKIIGIEAGKTHTIRVLYYGQG